ncbi:MAG: acylphosphatase [Microbacterium sp.]
MRGVHVTVSGFVQGVGYRYTLRHVAQREGVTGWVRNLRDGRVEAELEGPDAAVDAVLAWMAEGPRGAGVTGLAVSDIPAAGGSGFHIRHDG